MTTIRWHKNGDHPDDNVGATLEDPLNPGVTYVRQEGAVVRYFRHPDIPDLDTHTECGQVWRDHGWIDQGDGSFVCPGDLITTLDDGTRRVERPDEYVIVHSGRLAELFGKWGLPPWGDEMLGEDVDCGPLISLIGDDYEALLRSTPTLLVDMLADALALPERTCVEDRAVHLIAEVGRGINPRGGTFRRNLRRPEITDVEAMALVRRAIARLLRDDPERVLSWEDLPALTESEKRRVDDAMKDVADALDRHTKAACPAIDELWESLS